MSESNLREAIAELRRVSPPTRRVMRQLTRALVDLGDLLQQRGRYRAAEPVLQEAIQVAEKAFGKDHLEVATPLNSLAVCYKYMARYLDAGPLYQRALAIETKVLGAHHPNVGVCLENYSSVLHSLGRRTAERARLDALRAYWAGWKR